MRPTSEPLATTSAAWEDRPVRIERAVAVAAATLLADEGEGGLERVLDALLEGTQADFVFLDRNVEDPDRGFGFVNVAARARSELGVPDRISEIFTFVPWSRLPHSREHLERGIPVAFSVEELEGPERHFYRHVVETVTRSVLKLPIRRGNRWMGVLGFAQTEAQHRWTPEDVDLLRTVADLIGTFWERRDLDDARSASLAAMARRIEMEHALAEAGRMLLLGYGEDSLRKALEALRRATGASFVFVNTCEDDPELGPVLGSHVTVAAPGLVATAADWEYWRRVPWSRLPTAYRYIIQGRAFAFTLEELDGAEREWYEQAPTRIRSEVKIPIFVGGELRGIIGFSDVTRARSWDRQDLLLLATAARMVGVFWERSRAKETLERLVRSKDEFVAAVSHELRTPLTAVVGLAQELRSDLDRFSRAELEEFVGLIADQATEVAYIVEDLLVVARADIGQVNVDPARVEIRPELERVLQAVFPDGGVPVTGGPATVTADPARLRQILRNLATNARRYGGPNVEVRVVSGDGATVVEVRDDGDGIPPEDREHIFEPYRTAHDQIGQPASVGLGLTVSRQLARLMDGDLEYLRDGPWSVFRLTLPS